MDKMTHEFIFGGELLGYWFSLCCCGKKLEKEMYLENVEYKWFVHVSKYTKKFAIFLQIDVFSFLLI